MLIVPGSDSEIGVTLASRLGLSLSKREGHDLAGSCVACKSSDAFRLHMHSGVAQCYSCGGKWSPFQLAEHVLGREAAKALMVELGFFESRSSGPSPARSTKPDPIGVIAGQKGVRRESLVAYGARVLRSDSIDFPAYGPHGRPCTTFQMKTTGGKGLFAKNRAAGLFFPHSDGQVRLPQPGEAWYLAEGVKDAAALHSLGLLACGLNTCRLAAKFARLFSGAEIVLVPDRDRAGEEGSQFSARVLRGAAKSVRIAVLPAEFKESDGEDVRDVLRRAGGSDLVLQALADAQPPEGWQAESEAASTERPATASAEIELPAGDPLKLEVSPASGKPQRLVVEQSQSTLAANMAMEWDLFHTPANDAYATIPIGDHLETWPVRSQTFKHYLGKRFFDEEVKAMNSAAQSAAINLIQAKALFEGETHKVHVRVAEHENNIYLDLCTETWQVVEITSTGWQVMDESPVRFRRSKGMLPLPVPEPPFTARPASGW